MNVNVNINIHTNISIIIDINISIQHQQRVNTLLFLAQTLVRFTTCSRFSLSLIVYREGVHAFDVTS